ncbi:MAG: bifunctional folylpolyglutamate synthase/dihydrofolate synthase [Candidatus Omnitrophota bacterium]|nr:MAG: bifunctional folylpolyglutamate synthase/dihydrofolate synthase [Candidatus Omnitrophota bacterium]
MEKVSTVENHRNTMLARKYEKAKSYLDSFVNYERNTSFSYRRALKLKRVRHLFDVLGIAYRRLKVIHIAGTKGKGSTAHFCAYLLVASGFKVGLYTSPHFFSFRERIKILTPQGLQVSNSLISRSDVVRIIHQIQPQLERLRFSRTLGKLTFFEVYTAIALKYFIESNIDFAVLETGLGGRLDATNIVNPCGCLITHIGYDHTDKLGNRLADIASEKAGIVKKGAWVVSSSQRRSALEVIRAKCAQLDVPLYLFGRDFFAENVRLKRDCTLFDFCFHAFQLRNVRIYLKGNSQVENAALSLAATVLFNENMSLKSEQSKGAPGPLKINTMNFKRGLAETAIEGRFEIVQHNPLVIMDVAHNPSSFSVLEQNLKTYFPHKKIILIFAVSDDKDVKAMLGKIRYSRIILTSFSSPRSLAPHQIRKKCALKETIVACDIHQAYDISKQLYTKDSLILISGSLFLVSEAKKMFTVQAASDKYHHYARI